jgi:hypothetical protein
MTQHEPSAIDPTAGEAPVPVPSRADHSVHFYDDEASLLDVTSAFLAAVNRPS